jgi:murein DD-endopeptidase MepM/ murein hydrolase activator NlpD
MRLPVSRTALLALSCLLIVSCTRRAPLRTGGTITAADTSSSSMITSGNDTAAYIAKAADTANLLYGIPVDSYNVVTGKIRKNQFLSSILAEYGVPWNDIDQLLKQNREVFDARKVRTGSNYSVLMTMDTLSRADYFIYEHDPMVTYVFSLKDTLAIYRHDAEIYAWTIDFFGLQKGDRFKVIYEEEFIGEKSVGIRSIHAALFEHAGSAIYAIPFIQDSTMSFYDTTGASLRKAFLKAPLRYSRISSRFSDARLHPILKIVRPHHGVDYAAPIGTPVVSIGDGRVTQTSVENGSGRMVRITHNSVYSTSYLHLSRFGPCIAPGVYVKQGQVIGYVGSSGLSTGPHLDFRFYRNGYAVDPFKVESPPVNPVDPGSMNQFREVSKGYIALLETISY